MPFLKAIGNIIKSKPGVPGIPDVDVAKEQGVALKGNIENFGLIQELTEKSNALGLSESLKTIDEVLGSGTRDQIQANIKAGLGGELPKDVIEFVRRNAAEQAQAGGFGGSQAAGNLSLRDLGLTSLQRTDQALDSANRWLATAQSGIPQFNFSGMFVTPGQAIAQRNINVERKFQRDFVKNQIDAAFSSNTAYGQAMGDLDDFIGELLGSYLGSLGGAGGGIGG